MLLLDIAPQIRGMLAHALQLWDYVPVAHSNVTETLHWLSTRSPDIFPLAVIGDMAMRADPEILQQLHVDCSLLIVGIADRKGSPRSFIWGEWATIILPRPFSVRELRTILQRQRTAAA